MRAVFVLVSAVGLSTTGCSAYISGSGLDLSQLKKRDDVHQAFGPPEVSGQIDGKPFEEITTHRKIAENWKGIYLTMGYVWTFGLGEFVWFPHEAFVAARRSIVGQKIRFTYDAAGNVTAIDWDSGPVFISPIPVQPAATSTASSAKQEAVPLYFPTTVGTKWVYVWSQPDRDDKEVVEVVTAVSDGKDGEKLVTVGRDMGEELGENRFHSVSGLSISDRGLYQVKNYIGGSLDKRPKCELKLPHVDGQQWEIGLAPRVTLTASGTERVKVPAGEFDAIRVEYRCQDQTVAHLVCWYAPGVGCVKKQQGQLIVALKSFTSGR